MAVPESLKRWDVVVVGEIFADHVFGGFQRWPAPGEEVHTHDYAREPGGGAVNTACALARLGRRVHLVGLMGEMDRAWLEERLGRFGLPASGLRSHPLGTGVTVSVSTAEDRSFFTYPGANIHLPALLDDAHVRAELCAARHVHFAMPLDAALARQLLPLLHMQGCTTSLDVGFSPDWLRDPVNLWTCRSVDYFFPNQKEASILAGAESVDAFGRWVASAGLSCGVIKLGEQGSAAFAHDQWIHVPPPRVDAVDTTGGGDAFDAGFIDALLAGATLESCLRRACVCGALCTTRIGALAGLPDASSLSETHEQTYGS